MAEVELITPDGYYNYDPEIRDTWGCGPGGIGDWLVPDTIYGLNVKRACKRHDFRYRFRDFKDETTRAADDLEFFWNLQRIVDANTNNWLLRRLRFTRCRTMYWFVRHFGKGAYYETNSS